jgi:hypothetical protein
MRFKSGKSSGDEEYLALHTERAKRESVQRKVTWAVDPNLLKLEAGVCSNVNVRLGPNRVQGKCMIIPRSLFSPEQLRMMDQKENSDQRTGQHKQRMPN